MTSQGLVGWLSSAQTLPIECTQELNKIDTKLVSNQTRLFELIKWPSKHKEHVRLS